MTFTHNDEFKHCFLELERKQIEESRYYQVDDQVMYPSVTSIISFINRSKFAEWRRKKGNLEKRSCAWRNPEMKAGKMRRFGGGKF